MLDDSTTRSSILKAAMRLAEEKGWRSLSLTEIASAAEVPVSDLHREFRSKTAILEGFVEEVDNAVLKKVKPADPQAPARDRVFEVMMTRFDVLRPYKGAIRRIFRDSRGRLPGPGAARLVCVSANSHRWMLAAAGIPAQGPMGCVRVSGLMCVHARVMPAWLKDDEPDQAKTMAALDRHLRDGEHWLKRLDGLCCDIGRLLCRCAPRRRDREAGERPEPPAPPAPEPGPAPMAEQPGAG